MDESFIIRLELTDGTVERKEVVAIFPAENGQTYAAMLPIGEDGELGHEIEFFRATPCKDGDGNDDYKIGGIQSEAELDCALTGFAKLDFSETAERETSRLHQPEPPALPSFSMENENGDMTLWQMLDLFTVDGRQYAAAIPASQTENGISIFRLKPATCDGQEGFTLDEICTNEEFEIAKQEFERRLTINV